MILDSTLIVEENINAVEVFPTKHRGLFYLFSKKQTLRISMVNGDFFDFQYDELENATRELWSIERIRLNAKL